MKYQFPYTKVARLFKLKGITPFKFHPLIWVRLLSPLNNLTPPTEVYIDTGAQFCLFNNEFAKSLGIKDYKDTELQENLSGIGGKKPENIAYFHNLDLVVFKGYKKEEFKNKNVWKINVEIGFLEQPIGFSGILGVYGFLDRFAFKTNIPEGYFEIEPLFEI